MSKCKHDWTEYDNTTPDGPGPYRICFKCKKAELWHPVKGYIPAKVVAK